MGRETGRDGGRRLQYAREREKSFILMSEFFASFVTGSVGISVETRGIRWIVFLVAPPPPLKWEYFASAFKPRYGNDPEYWLDAAIFCYFMSYNNFISYSNFMSYSKAAEHWVSLAPYPSYGHAS